MNPVLVAVLAFLVGAVLSALVVGVTSRRRPARAEPPADAGPFAEPTPLTVPAEVSEVLAAVGSSTIVVGPQDEVVQASAPARSLGLVRGSRVTNDELIALVHDVRRDHEIAGTELLLGASGGHAWLLATAAPVGPDLIVVLAQDRTVERRVEDTRRDFVANVSHELKTPIGAVSLLAEALQDASDDPEAVRRFAGRLGIEARRLSLLVAQIIELSRLQAEDPLLDARPVGLDDVLAAAVDLRRVDAEDRAVTLTVAGDPGLTVLGSERQLTTALGNLVENAVVYSDPGARVVVAANRDVVDGDEVVEITVSDNGIGIAQADLDRIFERFYRVDYARSRDNGGTGLGLSIVKHVAIAHRGEVSVWSQPGRGSTFTIRLPLQSAGSGPAPDRSSDTRAEPAGTTAEEEPAGSRRGSGAAAGRRHHPKKPGDLLMTRVLVVEDETSYREAVSYMLRKEGFEVAEAADGTEGLAEYDRAGADLVLLDLMMPGLPGTEVCRQLRTRGNVPVIMLTARDSEVDKVVGLELGADDYVTKPFSHRELVARIRAVLRRGQDSDLLPDVVESGGVRMDVERHEVSLDGEPIRLALKEFELLEMLLRNAGRVMTRGQLIDRIWGADYVGDTKTLDVHVKRLRTKLEADPANPRYLVTVRGLGYKFDG